MFPLSVLEKRAENISSEISQFVFLSNGVQGLNVLWTIYVECVLDCHASVIHMLNKNVPRTRASTVSKHSMLFRLLPIYEV